MSWVADERPTSTAKTAIVPRFRDGSEPAMSQSPSMISPWHTSIHDRRCPNQLVSTGTLARSTNGAQRNLKLEARVTRLKKPITSSERPDARSQADSVSKTRKKGRPAENPSATMTSAGRSAYTPSAERTVRLAGVDAISLLMPGNRNRSPRTVGDRRGAAARARARARPKVRPRVTEISMALSVLSRPPTPAQRRLSGS